MSSVDGFQGQENKIIILSCERNNKDRKIGFLGNSPRLNVILTRAKDYMIVFGIKGTLSGDEQFKEFKDLFKNLENIQNENQVS